MNDIQILELSRYNQLPRKQKTALRLIKAEILQSGGVVKAYLLVERHFSVIGAYSDLLEAVKELIRSFVRKVREKVKSSKF